METDPQVTRENQQPIPQKSILTNRSEILIAIQANTRITNSKLETLEYKMKNLKEHNS
jgi:hypothetical protein